MHVASGVRVEAGVLYVGKADPVVNCHCEAVLVEKDGLDTHVIGSLRLRRILAWVYRCSNNVLIILIQLERCG